MLFCVITKANVDRRYFVDGSVGLDPKWLTFLNETKKCLWFGMNTFSHCALCGLGCPALRRSSELPSISCRLNPSWHSTLNNECRWCSIKKNRFIFDYNFRVSWSIFIIRAPVATGINTAQYFVIYSLNFLMTS